MTDQDHIDIERELRAAMRSGMETLPFPRVDLRGMRRRSKTRRRVLVPVLAATMGLALAAPIAMAKGVLPVPHLGHKAGSVVPATVSSAQGLTGTGQSGIVRGVTGGSQAGASGSHDQPGRSVGKVAGKAGSTAGAMAGCVTKRLPLDKANWTALRGDASKQLKQALWLLSDQLGKAGTPEVTAADLDHMLPAVGTPMAMIDCAAGKKLAVKEHTVVLKQVRAAVLSAGAVSRAVTDQTSALLSAGETATVGAVGSRVTAVRTTDGTMEMTMALSGGLLRGPQTVLMVMHLPDCVITKVDMSRMAGLDLGPLGFDLTKMRERLSGLGGQLPGIAPGVLAPDATLVAPGS